MPPHDAPTSWALHDERWADRSWDPLADPGNARRLRTLFEMCPQVESLLDVGCGNGEVLRALAGRARRRAGCDPARAGLVAMRARPAPPLAVAAGADRLPFRDGSFELVSCCDVLEHLPEEVALAALQEIMRVSSRYVLINVPLDEDLSRSLLRCDACGRRYHRDHHLRSYSRVSVEEMLPRVRFRLIGARTTGWTVRHPLRIPPALAVLLGLGHDPATRCDRCGARPAPEPALRRCLRGALVLCENALTRPLRGALTRDTEIAVLFERVRE